MFSCQHTELIKNYKNSVHHRDPYHRLRLGLPGASTIALCSMSSFETAHLPENLHILSIQFCQIATLIGRILRRCGISTLISILCICSMAFFIVTWLGWSCACVSFEIERTRWCCRNSSICALCTTISMCTLGFRFETVALR
jgi:hypothetical protein